VDAVDRCGQHGESAFVAAFYHPPRPTYRPEVLLEFIEACVQEITHEYPLADIVLAGDLNQLSDCDVVQRTGLTQIVRQPIRGANILDRVFVSSPDLYGVVRVVTSVVRSDHKAVVVFANRSHLNRRPPFSAHTAAKRLPSTLGFCSIWPALILPTKIRQPAPIPPLTLRPNLTISI
jgi:hypothetical protein